MQLGFAARERRSTQFALEGALSIAAGFVMFWWSATATHLLVTFALRARQRIEQARFEGPHAHHARPVR